MSARRSREEIRPEKSADGTELWHPPDPLNRYLDVLLMSRDGPQLSSDPIARNPRDVDGPGATGQGADGRPHEGEAAANAAFLRDRPWVLGQHAQAAPSSNDILAATLRFKWTLAVVAFLVSTPIIALIWSRGTRAAPRCGSGPLSRAWSSAPRTME
jgi:hypothetical protein